MINAEERVSDLLAFLAELDPEPLARALELPPARLKVRREVLVSDRAGRVDLLVEHADGGPLALLEVKIGAGQHAGQYAVYQEWAERHGLAGACWLVTLTGDDPDASDFWHTGLTLPDLLAAWRGSAHPHAAWLADEAAQVLEQRAAQLQGVFGLADDPVTADLLVKWLKVELKNSLSTDRPRLELWSGMRTNGGAPMLFGWLLPPGHEDAGVYITLDFRADSAHPRPRTWVLRLGVEVQPGDERGTAEARTLAHDLAVPVAERLTRTALVAELGAQQQHLAAALVPRSRGWHDGLVRDVGPEQLAEWRAAAAAGEPTGRHPLLYNDSLQGGGLRLASQLPLDAQSLYREDVLALIEVSIDQLGRVADDVAAALSRR